MWKQLLWLLLKGYRMHSPNTMSFSVLLTNTETSLGLSCSLPCPPLTLCLMLSTLSEHIKALEFVAALCSRQWLLAGSLLCSCLGRSVYLISFLFAKNHQIKYMCKNICCVEKYISLTTQKTFFLICHCKYWARSKFFVSTYFIKIKVLHKMS